MRKRLPEEVRTYLGQLGARGGKRAAALLTPAERKARATKASRAAAVVRTQKAQQKKAKG
jgi:hypothetical protein